MEKHLWETPELSLLRDARQAESGKYNSDTETQLTNPSAPV